MQILDIDCPHPTFQVLSDVHLEHRERLPSITPEADILLLAGDIGYPKRPLYHEFLKKLSSLFKYVILITGNHEYYDRRMAISKTNDYLQELVQTFPNVHFLNNSALRIVYPSSEESLTQETKSVRIWGGTFWTHLPPENYSIYRHGMNDYKKITEYYGQNSENSGGLSERRGPIMPMDTSAYHDLSLAKLGEEISKDESPLIVMTHHLPSRRCHLTEKDDLSFCYYSNNDKLLKPPITHWITGHDHTFLDIEINGVRCLRNPLGYVSQSLQPRNLVFQI